MVLSRTFVAVFIKLYNSRYQLIMTFLRKVSYNLLKFNRYFSTDLENYRIAKVPLPWGHLSAKWWPSNLKNDHPIVLSLHDLQDNSKTFDQLIPKLERKVTYFTIDLPGHGLSSPHPDGALYHQIDDLLLVKRLIKYYGWSQVSLMGHSNGAITAFLYSLLYPEDVASLICCDAILPKFNANEMRKLIKFYSKFVNTEQNQLNSIVDPRLSGYIHMNVSHTELLNVTKNLKCPVLVCKQKIEKKEQDLIAVLKENSKDFQWIQKGMYDVKLPELIDKFFDRNLY